MVGFKGSTQEKSIFEIFRFRLKKSPHDKKVPDRVGSGLMFGGGDAVFDELFEIAKVTPQSSGKQKRFVSLWDAIAGERLANLAFPPGDFSVRALLFSADVRRLYAFVASPSQTQLYVWYLAPEWSALGTK